MPRVLVIDDQSHVRAAIVLALQAKGFEVVAAHSGAAGLHEFNSSHFDLAIADVFMPGMDGVQLIKAMRERNPDLPVIAISGVPLSVSGRTALDLIPNAPGLSNIVCLQKPFRPAQLVQAIQRALGVAA